jgi:HK97 gp10 family phage protein
MSGTIRPNTAAVIAAAREGAARNVADLCDAMSAVAKRLTPVDSGNNRDNITSDLNSTNGRPVGRVYTESGYGGWLEIGTSRMAARPYFAPAYAQAKQMVR